MSQFVTGWNINKRWTQNNSYYSFHLIAFPKAVESFVRYTMPELNIPTFDLSALVDAVHTKEFSVKMVGSNETKDFYF